MVEVPPFIVKKKMVQPNRRGLSAHGLTIPYSKYPSMDGLAD